MASYNVSVTQSIELQPDNVAAGGTLEYVISNPLGVDSYFTLETVPNADGAYDSSSPKNTSGSYTLGSGLNTLIQNDYFSSVIVSPGGGTLTLVPAVAVTGSTLRLRGVGYTDVTISPSVDPDAEAFILAAGITNPTQQSAINTLVVSLKGYNIWTKMKAIYPFVGGTASTHKWNLKDPRDLDAAFRLVFSGGWTHSNTGALPNGTNGYADSKLNAGTALVSSSAHLSYYSRTNTNPAGVTIFEIGVANFGLNKRFVMAIRTSGDIFGTQVGALASVLNSSNTDSRGFFNGTRTSTTSMAQYKNGVLQTSNTLSDTTTLDSANVWLGGINNVGNPTGAFWSNRECAFASIGDGLTSIEAANLYTAVQAYQTTLSRNV
jgi:hypothetical protein